MGAYVERLLATTKIASPTKIPDPKTVFANEVLGVEASSGETTTELHALITDLENSLPVFQAPRETTDVNEECKATENEPIPDSTQHCLESKSASEPPEISNLRDAQQVQGSPEVGVVCHYSFG